MRLGAESRDTVELSLRFRTTELIVNSKAITRSDGASPIFTLTAVLPGEPAGEGGIGFCEALLPPPQAVSSIAVVNAIAIPLRQINLFFRTMNILPSSQSALLTTRVAAATGGVVRRLSTNCKTAGVRHF